MTQIPKEYDVVLGGGKAPQATAAVLGGFGAVKRKIIAGETLDQKSIQTGISHKCRDFEELRFKIICLHEYHQPQGLEFDWLTEKEIEIALENGARKSFYLNTETLFYDPINIKRQEEKVIKKLKSFTFSRYNAKNLVKKKLLEVVSTNPITRENAFYEMRFSVLTEYQKDRGDLSGSLSRYNRAIEKAPQEENPLTPNYFGWNTIIQLSPLGKIMLKYDLPYTTVYGFEVLMSDLTVIDKNRTLLRQYNLLDALLSMCLLTLVDRDIEVFEPRPFIPKSLLWNKWIVDSRGDQILGSLDVKINQYSRYSGTTHRDTIVYDQCRKAMAYAIALHAAHVNSVAYNLKTLERNLGIWNLHKVQEHLASQVAAVLPALSEIIDLIISEFRHEIETNDPYASIEPNELERVEADLELVKMNLTLS